MSESTFTHIERWVFFTEEICSRSLRSQMLGEDILVRNRVTPFALLVQSNSLKKLEELYFLSHRTKYRIRVRRFTSYDVTLKRLYRTISEDINIHRLTICFYDLKRIESQILLDINKYKNIKFFLILIHIRIFSYLFI